MAESDISISEMTNGTFSAGALFPAIQPSQQSGTGYSNVKMSGADIGDGIGQLQFPLRLETENKSIFGAINEAAKSIINFLPIDTASGSLASFPDGANGVPLEAIALNVTPAQSGSGDPSPSNVRPISGHDTAVITRTGKNIFDKNEVSNNKWLSTTTGLEETASGYVVTDYIPVKNGQTVFIPTSGTARRWIYDSNKNPLTYLNNSGNQAYTPTADGFIRVSIQVTGATPVSLDTYQIEVGTTATAYETYTAETRTVDLGQTIYGATINPLTGEGSITHGIKTFTGDSSESWTNVLSGFNIIIPDALQIQTPISNRFNGLSSRAISNLPDLSVAFANTGALNCNFKYAEIADLTAWKSYLANNPVQIVYKLAVPVPITITPIENINTLYGANNIFQDAGDISVTYRADIGLYIAKKTA